MRSKTRRAPELGESVHRGCWQFRTPAKIASAKDEQAAAAWMCNVAVKPLDNYSGDESKDYFADGMTDELITRLSQISAFQRVISRSTMMKYKRSPKSAREIARELDVATLVEGSVVL